METPTSKPDVRPAAVVKGKKGRKTFKQVVKTFFVGNFENAQKSVYKEVIVPGLKEMAADALIKTLGILLWDDSNAINTPNKSGSTSSTFHTAWNRQNGGSASTTSSTPRGRRKYSFDPVILATEEDAQHFLDAMDKWIKDHKYISIDDMYYLAGIDVSGDHWTDAGWGWYGTQGSGYRPCRSGWEIIMPDPVQLEIRRN